MKYQIVVLALLVACGRGDQKQTADTPQSTPSTVPSGPTTSTAPATGPAPGTPPSGATQAMVVEGDSIFHGQIAGGTCFTCHGVDAKGTPLAPPLIDHKWLTGDGTYQFIQTRVTEGMPNQTPPYPGPMLPMGGAPLSPAQIKSVAAYVYSISHR
jgi:mono/diheme cytochrome c family protein